MDPLFFLSASLLGVGWGGRRTRKTTSLRGMMIGSDGEGWAQSMMGFGVEAESRMLEATQAMPRLEWSDSGAVAGHQWNPYLLWYSPGQSWTGGRGPGCAGPGPGSPARGVSTALVTHHASPVENAEKLPSFPLHLGTSLVGKTVKLVAEAGLTYLGYGSDRVTSSGHDEVLSVHPTVAPSAERPQEQRAGRRATSMVGWFPPWCKTKTQREQSESKEVEATRKEKKEATHPTNISAGLLAKFFIAQRSLEEQYGSG
ncbi:hypothetical protein BKA65DRAFT_472909 [Rhexocercosporidium sp. MPI-PUGE-AT-0058]|nr:hypothetical protein BKA65DRAFT_472909 [Rhexocercosporidium sp. MPI-PUGE-AT-0058]